MPPIGTDYGKLAPVVATYLGQPTQALLYIRSLRNMHYGITGELGMMMTAFIIVIAPVEIVALPCPSALGGPYKSYTGVIIPYGRLWLPYYMTHTQR